MGQHILPVRTYLLVFGSLMVLTALTVGAAFADLAHPWDDVVALGIAITKATLVILFFMHVKYSTRLTSFVIASAFIWLAILVGVVAIDFAARAEQTTEQPMSVVPLEMRAIGDEPAEH